MLNSDGSILVRPLDPSPLSIVGLLKDATRTAKSVDQMSNFIAEEAVEREKRAARAN